MLTPESFTRIEIKNGAVDDERLGFEHSKQIYDALKSMGLIDNKGAITSELKQQAEAGEVGVPEGLEQAKDQVESIILHKAQKLQIKNKDNQVEIELQKDVSLDPAFQQLWERIRQTTRFEMNVNTEKLVEKAKEGISHMPKIRPLEVMSIRARLEIDDSGVSARSRRDSAGHLTNEDDTNRSVVTTDMERVYDLPDPIAELQDVVGLTRSTIKRILEGCGRFQEFEIDPMTFLTQVAAKIEEAKNEVVSQGIKYTRLPESEWYTMDILAVEDLTAYLDQNAGSL